METTSKMELSIGLMPKKVIEPNNVILAQKNKNTVVQNEPNLNMP